MLTSQSKINIAYTGMCVRSMGAFWRTAVAVDEIIRGTVLLHCKFKHNAA
jgi:hypothetical protein